MTEHHKITETIIFKTRIEVCRWKFRAEVGPFCRKGLRGPAATCEQMRFQFKISHGRSRHRFLFRRTTFRSRCAVWRKSFPAERTWCACEGD